MRVVIAGHDRLGIVMADILSEAGHDVLIVEAEGTRLRSLPSQLVERQNVEVLQAKATLDETMIAMDIRGADLFIAALRTPAENGLAALKARITYDVDNVIAVVNNESLGKVYERFDIRIVNPYTLALLDLSDTLNMGTESSEENSATITS